MKNILKKFLIFWEIELSSTKLKDILLFFLKKAALFQEGTCKAWKTKISYTSGNGIFWLKFPTRLKNFLYFLKKFSYSIFFIIIFRIFSIRIIRRNFCVVSKKLSHIFFLQQHIYILLKTLDDNSLYLFCKLNQSMSLIDKLHWEPSFGILLWWKFLLIFPL